MALRIRASSGILQTPHEFWDSTKRKEFLAQLTSHTYGDWPSYGKSARVGECVCFQPPPGSALVPCVAPRS